MANSITNTDPSGANGVNTSQMLSEEEAITAQNNAATITSAELSSQNQLISGLASMMNKGAEGIKTAASGQ